MNKEQKIQIVSSLTSCLTESKNIYFTEISGLDAEQTSKLRRMCFDKGVSISVVKNTLLKKAMDACEKDFSSLEELLKGNTTLMISDISNAPAKVIKSFLDKEQIEKTNKKVTLKGGHIEESIYVGHEQLEILVSLKSKEELIGDVITLLQSPVKNILSSLESAKQNISSLLTSLEQNPKVNSEKESKEEIKTDSAEEVSNSVDNEENIEKNDTEEKSSVE
ncbi:MAG: 50S ribosomal protein L10 [Flavobacteriales bacterium]|nr:50S ribosomal protein L10 [Flavobacteriales bacterium]